MLSNILGDCNNQCSTLWPDNQDIRGYGQRPRYGRYSAVSPRGSSEPGGLSCMQYAVRDTTLPSFTRRLTTVSSCGSGTVFSKPIVQDASPFPLQHTHRVPLIPPLSPPCRHQDQAPRLRLSTPNLPMGPGLGRIPRLALKTATCISNA